MTLLMPDNFKNNWYGWITNQWAHAVLGQMLFVVIMAISLSFGEFAPRSLVLVFIAIGYISWEYFTYTRGKFFDAVEDFCFVVIYGAGLIATCFHEVSPGQSSFLGDIYTAIPVIGLFAFHTTLGVFFRLERRAEK